MNPIILTIVTYFLTLFLLILIPIYWKIYGLKNFLWFSDIGLFLTVIALWLNSSLLITTAALLILPFELFWILDYAFRLITRRPLLGVAAAPSGCGSNFVFCETLKVPSQTPPKGYYVKMTVNGKSNPHATGICMTDGIIFSANNQDVIDSIKKGYLNKPTKKKSTTNKIVFTQCSDATCTKMGSSYTYQFTLSKSGSDYTAKQSTYVASLKPFGSVCTYDGQQVKILGLTKSAGDK